MTEWTNTEEVKAHLGLVAVTPTDLKKLNRTCEAVNAQIDEWRPDVDETSPLIPAIREGATRLAAGYFNRINSSGGDFAQFGEMSTAMSSGILDAEIQALIGIGRHHKPVVA